MLKSLANLLGKKGNDDSSNESNEATPKVVNIEIQNKNPHEENLYAKQKKLKTDFSRSKNDVAVDAINKGNVDNAIKLYKEAIELDQESAITFYNLGNAYFEKGELEEAIEQYRQSIKNDPKNYLSHYNLGLCLYRLDNLTEAIEHYQKALEIFPKDATIHYNLAKAYEKSKELVKAIEEYEKATEIQVDYPNAHYNQAELYRFLGYNKKAIEHFELYLKYAPEADDIEEVRYTIKSLR